MLEFEEISMQNSIYAKIIVHWTAAAIRRKIY